MSEATSSTLPAVLRSARIPALVVGLAALALSLLALGDVQDFYRSYLLGYLLVLGLSLGSMGLLFVHHLVGGAWGFIIQRQLEAATRVIPVLAVAFIPLALHVMSGLEETAHSDAAAAHHDGHEAKDDYHVGAANSDHGAQDDHHGAANGDHGAQDGHDGAAEGRPHEDSGAHHGDGHGETHGVHTIYHWADPGATEHDALLAHKEPYLNHMGFALRGVLYFAIWFALIFGLNYFSYRQDVTGKGKIANYLGQLSAPGIILYMMTMTFASFDWAMSLDPHWFSTIYGVIFVVGQVLSAMAFMIVVLPFTRRNPDLGIAVTTDRLHDLSKLLFAFTCLWTYVQLSQFLIIWYGNLPEEVIFYHLRAQGGWQYVGIMLVFGQFVFPFLLLISRYPKRSMRWAPRIAGFILAVRLIDLYYYLMPHAEMGEGGVPEAHLHLHWVHFTLPIGFFAVWLSVFLFNLGARPLLPFNDPRWKEKESHVH